MWLGEFIVHRRARLRARRDVTEQLRLYGEQRALSDESARTVQAELRAATEDRAQLLANLQEYVRRLGLTCPSDVEARTLLEQLSVSGDGLGATVDDIMKADWHQLAACYGKLAKTGEADASYRMQIDVAGVLCRAVRERFWATSTDRVSSFQTSNHYYYDALFHIAERLQALGDSGAPAPPTPRFARIFVGQLHSFAVDLIDDPRTFFELYRMHVVWGQNPEPDEVPIRFFVDDDRPALSYLALWEQVDIASPGETFIADFMLVDTQLVYGRTRLLSESKVRLKLSTDGDCIAKYEALFPRLWEKSLTIAQLTQKIVEAAECPGFADAERQHFLTLSTVAESKLGIRDDYGVASPDGHTPFPPNTRQGTAFFERVCQHIRNARDFIVAVDRADRKTANFWRAWLDEGGPYRAFQDSCAAAVAQGAQAYRLFVLEKRPKRSLREDVEAFVQFNAQQKMHIAFVRADAIEGMRLELAYIYDFILVNMPRSEFVFSASENIADAKPYQQRFESMRNECLGFELLGDQSFIPAGLDWSDNLIAKGLLLDRLDKFRQLWMHPEVIGRLTRFAPADVSEVVEDLFAR